VSFLLYPELKHMRPDLWDVCGKIFYEIGNFVPTSSHIVQTSWEHCRKILISDFKLLAMSFE